MYYAGIFCNDEKKECRAVVIEKVLRNARREYHVAEIRDIAFDHLAQEAKTLYEDPAFLRKKKVFSQDRRPPKNTFTPPQLIFWVKSGRDDLVQAVRDQAVPVDGFFLRDEPGWDREEPKILRFGVNLHVGRGSLDKLASVLSSSSMVWAEADSPETSELRDEVSRCLNDKNHKGCYPAEMSPAMCALICAVWHCETIRPIKRYGG